MKHKWSWSWGGALFGLVVGLFFGVVPALILVPLMGLKLEVGDAQ